MRGRENSDANPTLHRDLGLSMGEGGDLSRTTTSMDHLEGKLNESGSQLRRQKFGHRRRENPARPTPCIRFEREPHDSRLIKGKGCMDPGLRGRAIGYTWEVAVLAIVATSTRFFSLRLGSARASDSAPKFRLGVIERLSYSLSLAADATRPSNRGINQGERKRRLQGWLVRGVTFSFKLSFFTG